MKRYIKKATKSLSIAFAISSVFQMAWADEIPPIAVSEVFSEEETHCAAYRVQKVVAVFKKSMVVGINCEVDTKIETSNDKVRVIVTVPWNRFDSGEPDRDDEVVQHFNPKGDTPNIVFTSDWVSFDDLKQGSKSGNMKVKGKFEASGQSSEITAELDIIQRSGKTLVETTLFTTFKAIKLEPMGGAIFSISDPLQLYGRFEVDKVSGLEETLQ